ncbi:hypothetical protein OG756_26460 [Streptomyces sp. NBC_01310]|uniref:hypothetical protein n=1 Tax=Streptomyces sp. NBC_01310 TaxID=2903820 RepID=UPI0035B69E27|nr:hypothetical protein OG756_26460 [Streptomyces sp. NBC_01310]
MRDSIRLALEASAELTRSNQFVKAVQVAESAFERADAVEHREIEQWLTDHRDDFVQAPGEEAR